MPRPRFEKLPAEKRERILEAAAKEFSAHGYDGASMNRILDEAGISKGAAYYYFDDKADLFATAVMRYGQELMAGVQVDFERLTAENFWGELTNLYRQQFADFIERPWVFGMVKAGGSLPADMAAAGPLADLIEQGQSLLLRLLGRGRELGIMRTDLPDDLLLSMIFAVDDAHDRWLHARWPDLTADDLEQAAVNMSDALRRLLSPG